MQITLTESEASAAASLGEKRELLKVQRGKSPPEYKDGGGTHVERNRLGAIAEYALAKCFGPECVRDWCENKAYSLTHKTILCDVGNNTHVRATRYPNGGLILHHHDPDDGAFVLAIVEGLTVSFPGWLPGREAKNDNYWRSTGPGFGKRPAFCVPQTALLPMEHLPEECK